MLFFDSAHHHAEVPGFNHHRYATRLQGGFQCFQDLLSQSLLCLEPAREKVDDAGNFAEADHLFPRQVPNVYLPEEREEVMFAEGIELNIFEEDEFLCLRRKEGVSHSLLRRLFVSSCEKLHRFREAFGSLLHTRTQRIFSYTFQKLTKGILHMSCSLYGFTC